jgi:hypothetical protein
LGLIPVVYSTQSYHLSRLAGARARPAHSARTLHARDHPTELEHTQRGPNADGPLIPTLLQILHQKEFFREAIAVFGQSVFAIAFRT